MLETDLPREIDERLEQVEADDVLLGLSRLQSTSLVGEGVCCRERGECRMFKPSSGAEAGTWPEACMRKRGGDCQAESRGPRAWDGLLIRSPKLADSLGQRQGVAALGEIRAQDKTTLFRRRRRNE